MKYLVFFLAFLITSCDIEGFLENKRKETETTIRSNYNVIIVDGCEYLEFQKNIIGTTPIYSVTHKGNCKYCIERNLIK